MSSTLFSNSNLIISTSNTLLCIGQSATLSVSGANTYSWNTNETTNSIVITPTVTTNYSVNAIDATGCESTANMQQNVSLCTDIMDLTANIYSPSFIIYPNPVNDVLHINWLNNFDTTNYYTLKISNTLGQILIHEKIQQPHLILNTAALEGGIYFVQILSANTKTNKVYKLKISHD